MHISTEEQSTNAFDTLTVQVRSTTNQVRQTLATFSNLQARPGFHFYMFDLSAYRGQTIRVYFGAREDQGSLTSFVIDDVNILIENP